jgi:lipopolysaccharide export system ATP-binding protein
VRDTLSITDRAYIMYEGAIKRTGTAAELAADAEVREIYLGNSFRL